MLAQFGEATNAWVYRLIAKSGYDAPSFPWAVT